MFRGIKAERFLLVKESEKDEGDEGITADNSEAKDEVPEIKVVDEIADLPEEAVKSLVERGMVFMIDLNDGDKVYSGNIIAKTFEEAESLVEASGLGETEGGDRKSVGKGRSVAVRVDVGGRRRTKKNKMQVKQG